MRVLLAVDGSNESNEAVAEVARRPWPKGTVIRVVSVLEMPPLALFGVPAAYLKDLTDPIASHAQGAVDTATQILIETFKESVDVYGDVLKGSPKRVIPEEAERWRADLIVLGAQGHGAWENFLLGSVSQSILMHAKCSVEVVRSRKRDQS